MNFKDFILLINEFSDVTNLNTNEIELKEISRGYEYNFVIDEKEYQIYFYRSPVGFYTNFKGEFADYSRDGSFKYVGIAKEDRSFDIGLKAGYSYNTTNLNIPFRVYTNVFKGFKKFLEVAKPQAFEYYGYEKNMDLLYDKFYNKFLSKEFMRLDNRIYLKKKSFYSFKPEHKQLILSYIEFKKENTNNFFQKIKKNKIDNRQELIKSRIPEKPYEEPPSTARQSTGSPDQSDWDNLNTLDNPYVQRRLF